MSKYYDDARLALLMLDWYGVKYEDGVDSDYLRADIELNVQCEVYFIHEDSQPIFEPMVGDLIFDEVVSRCNYEQYYTLAEHTKDSFGEPIVNSLQSMGCFKVIQRDGKQFFTPQEES